MIIKEKNSKDEMAQKIITSKTGEKTSKDKEINISSWYQYDTIQTISEVNDEIWTFNDMENSLPSTCQYKIKSAANANTGEKFIIQQQISAANIGDWNTESWESPEDLGTTEDWGSTENFEIIESSLITIGSNRNIEFHRLQSNMKQNKILGANIRDWAPLWINDSRQVERVKKSIEKMIHIVRLLVNKKGYIIVGNWVCKERSEDERIPSHCENKWQELLSRKSLIKYLESKKGLLEQREFFRKECNKCHKKKSITSFCLYTSVMDVKERPAVEIICHLAWNKHYRVFGNWKCSNCEKKWVSAYTWMSLQKFIDKTPANHLKQNDFYVQKCKRCEKDDKNKSTIYNYEPLVLSDGDGPHKSHLCAKCQNKEYCTRTGTYFGSR